MSSPKFRIGGESYTVEQLENAIKAAEALTLAYQRGAGAEGSVDWEDVDAAHELAKAALFP